MGAFLSTHGYGLSFLAGLVWLTYLVLRPEKHQSTEKKITDSKPQFRQMYKDEAEMVAHTEAVNNYATVRQQLRACEAEKNDSQRYLKETQEDRERIRGLLGQAESETRECKEKHAHARLGWLALRARIEKWDPAPSVTIRFATYDDYQLVQEIENIVRDTLHWPIRLDGTNDPLLKPDPKFKVVFASGHFQKLDDAGVAFDQGRLVAVAVGVRMMDDRIEPNHLVIEVLPTVKA